MSLHGFFDPEFMTEAGWPKLPEWLDLGLPEPRAPLSLRIRNIQKDMCEKYGITMEEMLGERRAHRVAIPRMKAMATCVDETGYSLPAIGRAFGNRDHTTVMHAHRKYGKQNNRVEGRR